MAFRLNVKVFPMICKDRKLWNKIKHGYAMLEEGSHYLIEKITSCSVLLYPTIEGIIRPPLTGIITGLPPSIIEIAELVVPKSIPDIQINKEPI